MNSLSSEVQSNNYAGALNLLSLASAAELAENECKRGSGRYVATDGFSRDLPGIVENRLREKVLQNPSTRVIIPGTSDTASKEGELEFQRSADSFAFAYNLHAQYWNESVGQAGLGVVTLEDARAFIQLPKESWIRLPLNSKLRVRFLAELAEMALNR